MLLPLSQTCAPPSSSSSPSASPPLLHLIQLIKICNQLDCEWQSHTNSRPAFFKVLDDHFLDKQKIRVEDAAVLPLIIATMAERNLKWKIVPKDTVTAVMNASEVYSNLCEVKRDELLMMIQG